jgi:hypothetical protein
MHYAILARHAYGWDATAYDDDSVPADVWAAAQAAQLQEGVVEVLLLEVHLDGTLTVYDAGDGDLENDEPFA